MTNYYRYVIELTRVLVGTIFLIYDLEDQKCECPHCSRELNQQFSFYPTLAARVGYSDWCWCPHIYMFVDQKKLNRTLAIDSPFQTFAVGLLIIFIDWF